MTSNTHELSDAGRSVVNFMLGTHMLTPVQTDRDLDAMPYWSEGWPLPASIDAAETGRILSAIAEETGGAVLMHSQGGRAVHFCQGPAVKAEQARRAASGRPLVLGAAHGSASAFDGWEII